MVTTIFALIFFIGAYVINNLILTRKKKKRFGVPRWAKKKYKKIEIPTNKIVILSREYYEEQTNEIIPSGTFLTYNNDSETINSTLKYISILTYDDFFYDGKKYSFKSIPIEMSSIQLKEIFKKEETITIYYDELDFSRHYFDLSRIIKS